MPPTEAQRKATLKYAQNHKEEIRIKSRSWYANMTPEQKDKRLSQMKLYKRQKQEALKKIQEEEQSML